MLITSFIKAQQNEKYEARMAVGNHMVSFPFQRLYGTIYHPAIRLGVTKFSKPEKPNGFITKLNATFFYNRNNTHGPSLDLAFGYRYASSFLVYIEADITLGYMHGFSPRSQYKLKDGKYVSVKDYGSPALKIGYTLNLGVDLSQVSRSKLKIFMQYHWFAQTPYNAATPIWPQAISSVGMTMPLSNFISNKKNK